MPVRRRPRIGSHLTWEVSSGPIDDACKDRLEDPIGDTEVQTYPEEVVRSVDMKDDPWVEGIAMDRSNQHEGKLFDIDLRAEG